MAKMYTLDEKLLAGVPEIRIGEKVYKVDDREKTVKKVMALYNNGDKKDIEKIDEMFKLAFEPAAAKEISEMNMLSEIVISAMTGQEDTERFHE